MTSGAVAKAQNHFPPIKLPLEPVQLNIQQLTDQVPVKRIKGEDTVDTIQEFRIKLAVQGLIHQIRNALPAKVWLPPAAWMQGRNLAGPCITGHEDQAVTKIDVTIAGG